MAAQKTFDELLPIFRDIFDRDDIVLTPALAAEDVEEWDSLSNIRLFVAIEQAFGIRFASEEIASLPNVGALADVVEAKRGK